MCYPMLIAAGAALAGSLISNNAQQNAIKKQQNIVARAEENQAARNKQQQNLVLDEAGKFDPTRRAETMEQAAQKAEQSLGGAIAKANSAAPQNDAGATGRVSDEYTTARANSVEKETAKAAEAARLMSRARAPSDMIGAEGLDYADLLGQIGTIGSKAKGEWSRDMGRRAAVQPNSGQMLLGDALKAAGTAYGGYAAGTGMFGQAGNSLASGTGKAMMSAI